METVDQAPVQSAEVKPEQNLVQQVSNFKKPQEPAIEVTSDIKEFDDIKDPAAKEIAIKRYKSLQGDYTKKTQELAQQRRDFDAKLQDMSKWSPERIQRELLNNPEFIKAAEVVARDMSSNPKGQSNEEYSALNDIEKAKLDKVSALERELNTIKQAGFMSSLQSKHTELSTKYGDYEPQVIDQKVEELSRLAPQDILEYVYRAVNYEKNMQGAYELGKESAKKLNQEKINSFSPEGFTSSNNTEVSKEKGESDQNFFLRLYQNNKTRLKR